MAHLASGRSGGLRAARCRLRFPPGLPSRLAQPLHYTLPPRQARSPASWGQIRRDLQPRSLVPDFVPLR